MSPEVDPTAPTLSGAKAPRRSEFPLATIVVAGGVILAILAAVLFFTRSQAGPGTINAAQPLDPYAADLPLSQLAMSESESLSGGKSTFLDGHIRNNGTQTVTGVTVQVFFRNDEGLPPTIETLPLTLVRTREPYVDTESIASEPLKPSDEHEFRLIFETLPRNWNTQLPEVRITRVATR